MDLTDDRITEAIKHLVRSGRDRRYVTYEEVNAALPEKVLSAAQIETVMSQLSEQGIQVVEGALRARPVKGEIDYIELSREHIARYPKIRARLAG